MKRSRWLIRLGAALLAVIALSIAYQRAQIRDGVARCVNHMVSICSAGMIFASDNEDVLPTTFFSMSNELASPFILICPSRERSLEALPWDPDADYYDYEIISTRRAGCAGCPSYGSVRESNCMAKS